MSDALGSFLNQLIVCSGKPGSSVSIISDNARPMQDPDMQSGARRRRAPGRSASTPLNHMASRWEAASSFNAFHDAGNTQQRNFDRKSRWESETPSTSAIKLTRPTRESTDGLLSPFHDTGKLTKKHSSTKNLKKEMSTANLPKSLRSLPY
jgi:hypothetical protein